MGIAHRSEAWPVGAAHPTVEFSAQRSTRLEASLALYLSGDFNYVEWIESS
jgi:hypothetical protein